MVFDGSACHDVKSLVARNGHPREVPSTCRYSHYVDKFLENLMQNQDIGLSLKEIKNAVENILPGSRVILFGSRSRGDSNQNSDYDVMVVSEKNLDVKAKRCHASLIRKMLAVAEIPVDVHVKTENDISYYKDKIGSTVREAVKDGIALS